jgi:hypothetical protein
MAVSCAAATLAGLCHHLEGAVMQRIAAITAAALLGSLALGACGSKASSAGTKPPAAFVRGVDNPWFPLVPGRTYRYEGIRDGKPAVDVLHVTHRTRSIQGAPTTVVQDRLYLSGRLAERTVDWYAQDRPGNVWYLGEATEEIDRRGRVVGRAGSWRAGVNGAQAGIYMPAHPRIGQSGRQEYYRGQAEDHFRVAALGATVRVPWGSSRAALKTVEWTPLEPGVLDAKYYVRGVGTVYEAAVRGGDERLELVSLR